MKRVFKYLFLFVILSTCFFLYLNHDDDRTDNSAVIKEVVDNSENITETLKKKFNNDDIVGSISISGADINEAILQSSDNNFYLTHDNYGNYDKYGSVFLDYRCRKDSKKILVFGHNDYKTETPFSNLENYYYESYYKDNQFIDIVFDNEKRKYQIFSVYVETRDFTYMNLNISAEQYNKDLIMYKNKSLYQTNVNVSSDDEILVLQTCSNLKKYKKYKDKYLLIIAKRLS